MGGGNYWSTWQLQLPLLRTLRSTNRRSNVDAGDIQLGEDDNTPG